MEYQGMKWVVLYRAIIIVGLFGAGNEALASKHRYWSFELSYLKQKLSISSPKLQQAQIHTNFIFDLDPLITRWKPTINLEIVNLSKWNSDSFHLHYLPSGVSYQTQGINSCSTLMTIAPGGRCSLYFDVNKAAFRPHEDCGPHLYHHKVEYYLCNGFNAAVKALGPTQISVTPVVQDGLRYDAATHAIVGSPTRTGLYEFAVSAMNGDVRAGPVTVQINVNLNPNDKPVFKPLYGIQAARPSRTYRLNLMDLIEKRPNFGVTNQLHFRIDPNHTHSYPEWIHLDAASGTVLEGDVPASDVGSVKELSVIASSNTGGDSEPFLIRIPVAYDPTQKPSIQSGLNFKGKVATAFRQELLPFITHPVADGDVKVVLDKVEPAAPWLSVSSSLALEGVVPHDAVGQCYVVTLRAITSIGGSSDPVTIPLHIEVDPQLTPHFVVSDVPLTLLHAGRPYVFDFSTFNGITPTYQEFPFMVELASDAKNPPWLRIENNQIIIDNVPQEEINRKLTLLITLQNRPGGKSAVIPVPLLII